MFYSEHALINMLYSEHSYQSIGMFTGPCVSPRSGPRMSSNERLVQMGCQCTCFKEWSWQSVAGAIKHISVFQAIEPLEEHLESLTSQSVEESCFCVQVIQSLMKSIDTEKMMDP